MQQMPGESDDEYAVRANMAKQAVQQLTTLVNELDDLLLGWNVDAKHQTTYLDLELTAQDRHEAGRAVRRDQAGQDELRRVPAARGRGHRQLGPAR